MRICFVGPANSAHMLKWCSWFYDHGHEIHVISFNGGKIPCAEVHLIDLGVDTKGSDFQKLKYLLAGKKIKKIIDDINPEIINVHYATSYGMAMALSGIENYVLSVWGSDIYDFPNKSVLHKLMLKYSLYKAKYLFSTSKAMALEAKKYTKKELEITPFGVDLELFNPNKRNRVTQPEQEFIIGTVKALEPKYGINYLLYAAKKLKNERPDIPLKIRIAGKGSCEEEYKRLSQKLGIDSITEWLGFIPQNEAAVEWANMDLAIIASIFISESFGVSAVEAQACGTPVVISNVPGLMEATLPGETSVVVNCKNSEAIAQAVINFYDDKVKRKSFSAYAREFVSRKYEINRCFSHIENIYENICKKGT